MTRPVSRSVLALAVVLTVLAGQFAVHMLQLARKGDHRDFAAVYTAAQVFRAGGEFYDPQLDRETGLNHNAVLIETAKRLGTLHAHDHFVHIHAFSYPPFTVLAFAPFTGLSFRHAAVLWQALSLVFLAVAGWCLWRSVPLSPAAGLVLASVALVAEPLDNSLGLGQINLLILALTCLFVAALHTQRPAMAGVAIGLAVALRVHPALFILYLAWRKEWRACAWGVGTATVCTLIAIPMVGWDATAQYATLVAPQYARAFVGLGNHSLTGALINTGVGLLDSVPVELWRFIGQAASLGLLAAAFSVLRPTGRVRPDRMVAEIAFLSAVLLLATPNTTINHLVFTFIPLAVLLERALGPDRQGTLIPWIAVAVLLIGGLNDYYAHPLIATGPAVLFGGIKTYGLMILAALALRVVRPPGPHATP